VPTCPAPASLCVFEVLYARNSDVRALPLSERREFLGELVKPPAGPASR
jgi:ATP-dependent DNA ligase